MGQVRRSWRLTIWRIEDWFEEVADLLRQRACDHRWRPALTSNGPARFCGWCGLTQQTSVEMFYAYFGRMPF